MKRAYKKLAAILAGALCLATIGGTWAVYTNTVSIKNPFSTTSSSAVMVENFNPDSTFLPGESVEKQPYFKNTGNMDLVVRVKVQESWKDAKGNPAKEADTSKVTKEWTDSWMSTDWIQIGDYRYYKKILKKSGTESGEDRTPVILKKLTLASDLSNDSHGVDYSGLIYELNFEAEAVQADTVSVQSQWRLSAGDIQNIGWNFQK